MTLTVRVPPLLEQTLAEYCVQTKRTKSEVIVELLEQRFSGAPAGASAFELAQTAGFLGCVEGAHTAAGYKARAKAAIRAKHGK